MLDLTVDEAVEVFRNNDSIQRSLAALAALGLGYLKLGQPATELSGGECQRIKLAWELQRVQRGKTLYLLDEPSTGLHPADMDKLMRVLDRLVQRGDTVVMAEHDMRIAAEADWVLDLGPGSGENGGRIVATGTPEEVSRSKHSLTAPWLAARLKKRSTGRFLICSSPNTCPARSWDGTATSRSMKPSSVFLWATRQRSASGPGRPTC